MTDRDHDVILAGDPIESIEAAKRLIAADAVDAAKLRDIAVNRKNKTSARVAAIYAVGFSDDPSMAGPALKDIAANPNDDEECRAHAAEALAHLDEASTVPLMEEILARDDSTQVKRWCVYALGEIGSAKARKVLRKFAKTNPTGAVADELRIALSRQ